MLTEEKIKINNIFNITRLPIIGGLFLLVMLRCYTYYYASKLSKFQLKSKKVKETLKNLLTMKVKCVILYSELMKRNRNIERMVEMESLKIGLKQLGIKGKVTAYPLENDHEILVLLNNDYFGIWDSQRKIFID